MSFSDPRKKISTWETRYPERLAAAKSAAHAIDDASLLRIELDQLADALVNDHAAQPVVPLWDRFSIETRELPQARSDAISNVAMPLVLTAWLPVEGAAQAVKGVFTVGQGTSGPDSYSIGLQMAMESPEGEETDFGEALSTLPSQWFAAVGEAVRAANEEIKRHGNEARTAVMEIVKVRQRRLRAINSAAAVLNIPLNRAPSTEMSIPMEPRALTLRTVEEAANAGGSEAGLATDIADALVSQISSFAAALERLPRTANKLAEHDEETLRDILLFILNANWSGRVTGETFVGDGKTDIHMTWREREAFIGECKFWNGERKFTDALDQLLDRYTVWRATRVALILFIRNRNDITEIINKAWATVTRHPRYVAPATRQPESLRSALMQAQHDRQQLVTLTLIPVVIPGPATVPSIGS